MVWIVLARSKQYVEVGDSRSGFRDIKIGVPLGSILGPVFFILYNNDMCNSSDSLKFIHFADDTTVFFKNENLYILCEVANHELSKVDEWLISNILSLNVGKSLVMLFTNRPNNSLPINVQIRSVPLNRVSSTKF